MNTNIHIVCSAEKGVGKTFLARICADMLISSGHGVTVFDTETPSGSLARRFPDNSEIINFQKMREQVRLFDRMVNDPGQNYVIDLQTEHLGRFFTILHDTKFDMGAREAGLGTGVYFLPGPAEASLQRESWIRGKLTTASFTSVASEQKPSRGSARAARVSADGGYRETVLPRVTDLCAEWIAKPDFRFSWHYSGSLVRPPSEVKLELTFFM